MSDVAWTQARNSLRPHPEFTGDPNRDHALEDRMRLYNVSAISIAI